MSKTLNNEIVFQTEWFSIEKEYRTDIPSMSGKPFYRINTPDGVLILAYTEDKKIIFVRQYRPAIEDFTIEIPAGSIDKNETPLEAAKRELYEETGYTCEKWELVSTGRIMMNRFGNIDYAFVGFGARKDEKQSPEKGIDVVLMDREELKSLCVQNKFDQFVGLGIFTLAEWKSEV